VRQPGEESPSWLGPTPSLLCIQVNARAARAPVRAPRGGFFLFSAIGAIIPWEMVGTATSNVRIRHEINLVTCVRKSLGLYFYDRGPARGTYTQAAIEQIFIASLLAFCSVSGP
jgi:hypothetical protein